MKTRDQKIISQQNQDSTAGKIAYVCHIILGAIVVLSLAMGLHLKFIDAGGEVLGAGIFLIVMLLGIPAFILTIFAVLFSVKSHDRQLFYLTVALVILLASAVIPVSFEFMASVALVYIALIIILGYRLRHNRKSGTPV